VTKNSLARPLSEPPDAFTGPDVVVAVAGIGGATGRAERTVITIAARDCVNLEHPVKVSPVHKSHALPADIRMLFTAKASIDRVGPEIVML
jgi:hypothetical protein